MSSFKKKKKKYGIILLCKDWNFQKSPPVARKQTHYFKCYECTSTCECALISGYSESLNAFAN